MQFRHLILLFILSFSAPQFAQNLPEAWSIGEEGNLLTAGGEVDRGFFNPNEVRTVSLQFTEDNWWAILEANYGTGTDLLATCFVDGERFDSVGVRFKGETSYSRNPTEKKSFNITLDAVIDGQDVDGYNTFNLNCGWEDNSSMREVLYNNVGHNYYMSLKAGYANLEINGQNWGPYQNVQQFDSDYIREWYLSNDGTIWRATSSRRVRPGPGGGRFGQGFSTLNYNGPDSTDYVQDYVLRRTEQDDPWAGLIAAVDVLNNEPLSTLEAALAPVLDIDKACWFLAHENVWADDDGYINKGGSDYFVYYEAETGRIVPMEYDGNSVLGDRAITWGPLYREGETDFPLINRMLAVPEIRQRYLAHVRVILEDYFTVENTTEQIDAYAALIGDLVEADPKKFYTNAEWAAAISDLKSDGLTRRNNLLSSSELVAGTDVTVSSVTRSVGGVSNQNPTAEEVVNVTATVGAAAGVAEVWLHYGAGLTGVFDRAPMFDDGQHGDGSAGDGRFGGEIPALSGANYARYYIAAIADDAAATVVYEPRGAEHDVFIYQISAGTSAQAGDLVINEFMAANDTTQADQDGEFDDWIELYNNSSSPITLDGYFLSDDLSEQNKWSFPAGTTIEPNDYLIVWADEDEDQDGLHADFKLSANGEQIVLSDLNLAIIDSLSYPEQEADVTYGRFPNGTGNFRSMVSTFNAENTDGSVGTSDFGLPGLSLAVFPNPSHGVFLVELEQAYIEDLELNLYGVDGRIHYATEMQRGSTQVIVEGDGLAAGVYLLAIRSVRGVETRRVMIR